jgi:hypothetical protein
VRRAKPERFDRKRGRHKKRASRETRTWNEELLIPERPPWMSASTYKALADLRDRR